MSLREEVEANKPTTPQIVSPSIHPESVAVYDETLNIAGTPGWTVYTNLRNALGTIHDEMLNLDAADREFGKLTLMSTAELKQHKARGGKTRMARTTVIDEYGRESQVETERAVIYDDSADRYDAAINRCADRCHAAFAGADTVIKDKIGELETRISRALSDPNANNNSNVAIAAEVRTYLRAVPDAERFNEALQLLSSGDIRMVAAVLQAPLVLTKLKPDQHTLLMDAARRRFAGADLSQLEAARKAQKQLENAASFWMGRTAAARPVKNVVTAKKVDLIDALASGRKPKAP